MKNSLKLYIWDEPYPIPYGNSCLFVLAHTLTEAKKKALKQTLLGVHPHQPHRRPSKVALGKPDRVIRKPAAVWIEWEE